MLAAEAEDAALAGEPLPSLETATSPHLPTPHQPSQPSRRDNLHPFFQLLDRRSRALRGRLSLVRILQHLTNITLYRVLDFQPRRANSRRIHSVNAHPLQIRIRAGVQVHFLSERFAERAQSEFRRGIGRVAGECQEGDEGRGEDEMAGRSSFGLGVLRAC